MIFPDPPLILCVSIYRDKGEAQIRATYQSSRLVINFPFLHSNALLQVLTNSALLLNVAKYPFQRKMSAQASFSY